MQANKRAADWQPLCTSYGYCIHFSERGDRYSSRGPLARMESAVKRGNGQREAEPRDEGK